MRKSLVWPSKALQPGTVLTLDALVEPLRWTVERYALDGVVLKSPFRSNPYETVALCVLHAWIAEGRLRVEHNAAVC